MIPADSHRPLIRTTAPWAGTDDDFGNLAELGDRTIPVSWATNRLTSATYDLRGNVTSEPIADGWTRRLRFDLDNQLVAAWASGPNAPEDHFGFAYDLPGERVLKYRVTDGSVIEATFSLRDEESNVLTDFLWAPTTVGNTTGTWHRLADHVFLGRRPLVHRQSQGTYPITYTTVVTDHLQSTRKEISNLDNPAAQATFTYWPFGEFAERLGTPTAKHLYTAHEREDTGTEAGTMAGLDYMHARYYSPLFGRLASIDQLGGDLGNAGKSNRYAYALNCPLTYLDPDGRNPVASDQAIRIIKEVRAQSYWRLMDVPVVGTVLAAAFDTLVTAFPSNDAIAIDLVPFQQSLLPARTKRLQHFSEITLNRALHSRKRWCRN